MKAFTILLMSALMSSLASSLAVPQSPAQPPLDYVAVPESFTLPAGMTPGSTSGVAINSKGHVFILHRGPDPLMEFDPGGKFIRAFGAGFFDRPHGLRIDAQDNIWATDVATHRGLQVQPGGTHPAGARRARQRGRDAPMAICACSTSPTTWRSGRPARSSWCRATARRAEGRQVRQGRQFHQGLGQERRRPRKFDIAHSIAIDAKGLLYVADRNNQRIQVFDADGTYLRESKHPGTPCGLFISPDQHIWMAHGHAGQVIKLDLDGKVLGVTGKQGKALGQFGEAHYIALSAKGDVYVADTLNWRVQKFVYKAP